MSATKIVSIDGAAPEPELSLRDAICEIQEQRMQKIRDDVRYYLEFCARIGVTRVRLHECDWIPAPDRKEVAAWLKAEGFELRRGWSGSFWIDLRCTNMQPPSEE
jgi:hypothetical protein